MKAKLEVKGWNGKI